MKRWILGIALVICVAGSTSAAGLMKPTGGGLPDLTLEEHLVTVTINNGFAITEVDQTFHNPHDRDLDAIYTFPLPRSSSLSELSLWIDGEEHVGEVVEKEEARRIAKREREAGRETALAEQREYYAYDVLVSPVRAGSRTRVRLLYLQPIEIDGGTGRYVYPLQDGEIDEASRSFWTRNERVSGHFLFDCTIRSSYPVDDVRAKGLARSVVAHPDPSTWTVWIEGDQGDIELDEDLVVYYRLAPDQPARVDLLPYRDGSGQGSYMLVVTPGGDLDPIAEGVDWTFVLDVSGSMEAKLATAARALRDALGELRPADRFRVITFSNDARDLTPGFVAATPENVRTYAETLARAEVEGGTNVYAGMAAGLQGLEPARTAALVLVSDGGANVGPTHVRHFLKLLENTDVRVFTFVMGQGANEPLLGRIAEESGGFTMDVSTQDDLFGRLMQAREKLGREAMHGVRVKVEGVPVTGVAPVRLPSVYFGQQIVQFGRYTQAGDVTLTLSARISGEDRQWTSRIHLPESDTRFPEIERLWALARVEDLQREIDDGKDAGKLRAAIVDIGTTHSIVTEHTSMIVVRPEVFEELGIERRNRDRVQRERTARAQRVGEVVQQTRADEAQPLFGDSTAHQYGGGVGAVGPGLVVLLAGLYGLRRWAARNDA